jgi:hypothetical protein
MMSCCSCGIILNLAGFGSRDRRAHETTEVQSKSSTPTEKSAYSNLPPIETEESREHRRRLEERLAGFTYRDIINKYGHPSRTLQDPVNRNYKYFVWKIGGKDTELYVVQMVVFALDGSGRTIDSPPVVVTDVGLARTIRTNNLE